MAYGNFGHIRLTVSSVDYDFLVDLSTYQEVDITDFAPRAISGSPALSLMGLYTDASQSGFRHGYGEHTYSEPLSYAYSGTDIDTRHNYISLHTADTLINTGGTSGWVVNDFMVHNSIRILATTLGIQVIKDTDDLVSAAVAMPTATACAAMVDMGDHLLFGSTDQTQVGDVFKPTSATTTVLTNTAANWVVDLLIGGTATIVDGTGAGQTQTISDMTATTITVTAFSPAPSTDSIIIVRGSTSIASADNMGGFAIFGGYVWAYEAGTNFLHFAAESDGSDLEGGGTGDTGVITVGPPGTSIRNLQAFNNQLWVFKDDGAWTIGEDNLAFHTLNHKDELSSSNFQAVTVWNGFLIMNIRNTIYKYRSGLQDITPPVWNQYPPSRKFGDFQDFVPRGPWLYTIGRSDLAGPSTDEAAPEQTALFGALLATSGVGWHKLWTFPLAPVTNMGMWLDNVNNRLMIFGTAGGSGYLHSIDLQGTSDLPMYSFTTSTYRNFYTSYYDMGLSRIPKSFASVTLAGDYPANTQVRVQYRVDDDTAFTTLGTFTTDMQEIDFSSITGKRIQLRLQLYTTTSTSSPHIRAIILKVMLRPDVLYGVTCDVLLADKLSDQNRLINGMTTQEIRTALKAARASVSPITFTGIGETSGSSAYLASARFTVMGYEDSDDVELMARCTIVYV